MAISRRTIFKSVAAGALGLSAHAVYRQSPNFWRQFAKELFTPVADAVLHPQPATWQPKGLHAAWLGHSTTLIRIDGFTILTDPVFSPRCGIDLILGTLGPKRLVAPALTIGQLPKIDLILLSHAHFDHWDLPSLKALASKNIPIVCARQTQDLLNPGLWQSVKELGWRERTQVGPVNIRAIEVKHWGARVRNDSYRGYNGYLIEAGNYKVLFSGDTAHTNLFREIRTAKPIDLAIMPIGAYDPWIANHCTPEQAIQLADWANAERIMPVHHQTFVLSSEPPNEPIERLFNKLGNSNQRAVAHQIGSQWSVIT